MEQVSYPISDSVSVHRCIIVTNEKVEFARSLGLYLAGPFAENMWQVGLSETGQAPATHWVCAGMISSKLAELFPMTSLGVYDFDEQAVVDMVALSGATVTVQEVEELISSCDISEGSPIEAMTRMGLSLISEDAAI